MNLAKGKTVVLNRLFYAYLKLLKKTVKIHLIQPEAYQGHNVVGFWHEDSFAMNLVLEQIKKEEEEISVLVTGDERGEYIQYLLEKCGGRAVRIGYGFCNMKLMKEILTELSGEKHSVAVAMDGPLGPRHIPKKLTFFLSEKSGSELVGATVSYSGKITVRSRWDHYKIPLPFTTVNVRFDNYKVTSCHNHPAMRVYHEEPECSIIPVKGVSENGNESCAYCRR